MLVTAVLGFCLGFAGVCLLQKLTGHDFSMPKLRVQNLNEILSQVLPDHDR